MLFFSGAFAFMLSTSFNLQIFEREQKTCPATVLANFSGGKKKTKKKNNNFNIYQNISFD